jgi:hypothetical protein
MMKICQVVSISTLSARGRKVSTAGLKTEKRASVGHISTLSERANPISADTNDATVTEADFAEIEAFANDSVLV